MPLAALLILGAVFAVPVGPAEEKAKIEIDTAPPIEMSKCAPCHLDLNSLSNPKLVNFNHPVHFEKGITCTSCHIEWPHQNSLIIRPTMDLCMNCHRLSHSSQGKFVSGDCSLCHPPGFKLTPTDHDAAFVSSTHKQEASKSVNQECLICHQGLMCQNCHQAKGLGKGDSEDYRFKPVLKAPKKRDWPKLVIKDDEVRMSGCRTCHTDLQVWEKNKTNPLLINFNHPVHFERGIRCDSCHKEWPHKPDEILRPVMYDCAKCHRLSHSAQGMKAPGECGVCHPKGMDLVPEFHTVAFKGGEHREWAKEDRGLCRTCHIQEFCDNCHILGSEFIPHRLPEWTYYHGTVANSDAAVDSKGNFSCSRCHQKDGPAFSYQSAPSCAKCHKAVVFPHVQPWAPLHGKTAVKVGKDACYTCHRDALICESCHKGIDMPHAADWIGKHRAFLQNNQIELCLNCHKRNQCEQCHAVHKVHNSKSNYDFSELKEGR